jgi:hypothetical protein
MQCGFPYLPENRVEGCKRFERGSYVAMMRLLDDRDVSPMVKFVVRVQSGPTTELSLLQLKDTCFSPLACASTCTDIPTIVMLVTRQKYLCHEVMR